MDTYNYEQTLEIVENFMIETGIRNFCTEICKGQCCGRCYESNKNACHKHEGRRLACSAYICYGNTLGQNVLDGMDLIMNTIHALHKIKASGTMYDVYFEPPPAFIFESFKVKAFKLEKCYVEPIEKTKKVVNNIIECWNEWTMWNENQASKLRPALNSFKTRKNGEIKFMSSF